LILDFESKQNGSSGGGFVEEGCISWDPHSSKQCAVGIGKGLRIVDTREMEVVHAQPNAHDETIRCVDYNPNKPLLLITTGNDRLVKIWDTRNMSKPTKVLAGHTHWTWAAKYNPHHDQLIIR
jgi:EARP and GARP complex-interacting protein 1